MQKTVEAMLGYFTQIRQVYAGELNRRFEKEKFSPNEMSVLILLSNNRTIDTASQMRVVLGVSKGLVSRSIESLAERGLVECRQDERDRRIQRVCLTGAAAPFVRRLNEEIGRINREVLADISQEEIDQMENTMMKVLQKFTEKDLSVKEMD
ncbi:MarR family winged helix-turn-helix transcriptional regulator [Mordavella massiliensis]|uniref:MarR family transcriptional regulator n=1 Tax=Mordavella massiliensis TaxID=1871024 RepID=A0A938XA89_9CLOT|nr:MarR family transcriptional regulator [Mordavella massiliensis]MBM6947731.1 MarR family transcriptional regulator [Mordavella massiliensis]